LHGNNYMDDLYYIPVLRKLLCVEDVTVIWPREAVCFASLPSDSLNLLRFRWVYDVLTSRNKVFLEKRMLSSWRNALLCVYSVLSQLNSLYKGCPESIQPFWISQEPVAWPWC